MKFLPLIVLFFSVADCQSAVIYRHEPKTIVPLTPENTIIFDLDGNGVEDWRIEAFYNGNGTPVVRVGSPETTSFLYEYSITSMIGKDFQPLLGGTLIGLDSETINIKFGIPRISGIAPFAVGFPLPDPREGDNNFIGKTAYLGFRFLGDDGYHYGYALFTDTTSRGTTLLATGWETEVDRPILAGSVPEPSVLGLLGLSTLLSVTRRRAARC
ncbi:MAG: PEP-CTERM sorting domain-containing protein [Akkermansiaceae bacterium]|jgi:hypothetical protein